MQSRTMSYDSGPAAATLNKSKPARPVIWLWNNNVPAKYMSWDPNLRWDPKTQQLRANPFLGHYEGFGRPQAVDEEHKRKVQSWGLGALIRDDLKRGVWKVTKDVHKTHGNELEVLRGHFVRESNEKHSVPAGFRFMVACNGLDGGLVPENSLVKINLHDSAPSIGRADRLLNRSKSEEKKAQKPSTTRPPISAPRSPRMSTKQSSVQLPRAKKSINATSQDNLARTMFEKEKANDRLQESREIFFKVFRGIRATGKTGGYITEDLTIDGYEVTVGGFYLEISPTPETVPSVIDLNGVSGRSRSRVLQRLDEPWGLPEKVTVIGPMPAFDNASLEDIQNSARRRNLEISKSTNTMIRDIVVWENEQYMMIPLFRLKRRYTAKEANARVDFLEGEAIRVLAHDTNGNVDILDYE